MATQFFELFSLRDEDDTEITVCYTFSPGCGEQGPSYSCGGQPAEPPEVEILGAELFGGSRDGEAIKLSEEDEKRIHQWLIENHEPEEREYE